jgi:hypothetical protein
MSLVTIRTRLKQVEAIIHNYVLHGPQASEAVRAILRQLSEAPDASVRVMAVEMVVNAALRSQLLLNHDWSTALSAGSGHPVAHSGDEASSEDGGQADWTAAEQQGSEALALIQHNLRCQFLRLIEDMCRDETLDACVCEASVSALLLLCTHQRKPYMPELLCRELPLEALAALATHCLSNATRLHADGAAHALLLHIIVLAVHGMPSGDATSIDAPQPPAPPSLPPNSRAAPPLEPYAQRWGWDAVGGGFEERVRRVGGMRWLVLQLQRSRSASGRVLVYSVMPSSLLCLLLGVACLCPLCCVALLCFSVSSSCCGRPPVAMLCWPLLLVGDACDACWPLLLVAMLPALSCLLARLADASRLGAAHARGDACSHWC